jgi:hypothetical protein
MHNPIKAHLLDRLQPQVQPMTEEEYLPLALRTWTAPLRGTPEGHTYLVLGLLSELGEVADVLKKAIRNGTPPEGARRRLVDELGDVLWYSTITTYEASTSELGNLTLPTWIATIAFSGFTAESIMQWAKVVYGITADECRAANIAKLTSRAERGVIQGSGGDR